MPKGKIEQTARFALKLLVEENCSDDEAVKMAKDANGYADEGLAEQDAIMSSRVKKSLEDSGLPAEHARAIGKNIRAGGTSSADDAKAVAQAMKIVSKKAIDTLTADGITTQCCRGPITDAAPDLAGVKPRGWPETASWDEVPGVYMGGEKKLIVGTRDDGGKREVPPKDKGPLPHGATDLFGHEAGHAFDAADGGGKKENAAFLAARSADIATGNPGGMIPGTDDYFLTKAEKGANDAGATSETFAESFAMHFAGKSRWPKLEEFWKQESLGHLSSRPRRTPKEPHERPQSPQADRRAAPRSRRRHAARRRHGRDGQGRHPAPAPAHRAARRHRRRGAADRAAEGRALSGDEGAPRGHEAGREAVDPAVSRSR